MIDFEVLTSLTANQRKWVKAALTGHNILWQICPDEMVRKLLWELTEEQIERILADPDYDPAKDS